MTKIVDAELINVESLVKRCVRKTCSTLLTINPISKSRELSIKRNTKK